MKLIQYFFAKALPTSFISIGDEQNFVKVTDLAIDFFDNFHVQKTSISIDSRTILPNEIFLALQGNKNDGHDFVKQALSAQAFGIIIEESKKDLLLKLEHNLLKNKLIILVPNTFEALFSLAKCWREQFNIPIIGVTGSIGKTTTKEMLRAILTVSGFLFFVSLKNQNTIIGLSLNILRMDEEIQYAVFELGIDARGEMSHLVDLLRPTVGIITKISNSHTLFLGSHEEIAKEKRQLFKHFGPNNIGIICGDQPIIAEISYPHPVIKFGFKSKNNVIGKKIRLILDKNQNDKLLVAFDLKLYDQKLLIKLNTINTALVNNALAAASAAHFIGIKNEDIALGLASFSPFEGRSELKVIKNKGSILINDCYNANPDSMKAALISLHNVSVSGKKIAVLGDMLELGNKEKFWHRQVGRVLCKAISIKHLILVGDLAKFIAQTAPINTFVEYVSNWQEAQDRLLKILSNEDCVLVKGSFRTGLSNLVKEIT